MAALRAPPKRGCPPCPCAPAHACAPAPAPQSPAALSQSRGPSPGRDPDSPRPRREQSRGKGEPAEDSAQTRGPETPPQAAHTSAAVGSAPGTGVLSADPVRGCDLRPVPRAARQNPRLTGRPARDAEHGAPATEHGPASRQRVTHQHRGRPCRSRAGDRGTSVGGPGAETWRSSSDRRRGEGPPPKPASRATVA